MQNLDVKKGRPPLPYKTVTLRVPEPLADKIRQMAQDFKEKFHGKQK